jgi:hypothetical protein
MPSRFSLALFPFALAHLALIHFSRRLTAKRKGVAITNEREFSTDQASDFTQDYEQAVRRGIIAYQKLTRFAC